MSVFLKKDSKMMENERAEVNLTKHVVIYPRNYLIYICIYQIKKKSNNPNVCTASPLKTRCLTARSKSCLQWTGMTSSHDS